MPSDLVRARIITPSGRVVEKNIGRARAIARGYLILPEPVTDSSGRLRRATRANGRPMKRRTTVTDSAAAKKAVTTSAAKKKEQDQ